MGSILLTNGKPLLLTSGSICALTSAVAAPESYGAAVNGNTAAYSYRSTGSSRDQSVSFTRNYVGRIFLRLTDAGEAIMFDFAGSFFNIYLASGVSESSYSPTVEKQLHSQGGALSGTIVVGCSGFDIYVTDDGVEVVRFKSIHHTASGKVACKEALGQTRSAGTVTFAANAELYSTITSDIYDPRDFGLRSIATTGTISASSTTLTVASATGFLVGDHVIVEIGNEAGAGARGTRGVGGTWPALSYANAAARAADTSQANNTFAWQIDTGDCWRWVSSAWTQPYASSYYLAKAAPRSLQAKITAISGNDLTLNVAATVTATTANVYLDCTPFLNLMLYHAWYKFGSPAGVLTSFLPSSARIVIPAGTYYCGGYIDMGQFSTPFTIEGAGDTTILKSPKGVPSISIMALSHTSQTLVSRLKMVGNVRDTGFGMDWPSVQALPFGSGSSGFEWSYAAGSLTETSYTGATTFCPGILMTSCTSCTVEYVTSVDIWQKSIGMNDCTNSWGRNSSTTYTDGLRMYIQWCYLYADGSGGGFTDISVSCTGRLVSGAEIFRSTGSIIDGFTGTNATLSANSAGDFTYTDCAITVTVTDNVEATSGFSINNPLININDNIGGGYAADGGSIVNATFTQAARIDANNNTLRGIVISANNQDIVITGGSFSSPDYLAPATTAGAAGIISQGSNTDVTGFTVTGKAVKEVTGSGYRNIHLEPSSGLPGSSATGCTANEIYVNP